MNNISGEKIRDIKRYIVNGLTHVQNLGEWCEENHIGQREFDELFELAERQAAERDWLMKHRAEGYGIANTTGGIAKVAMDAKKSVVSFEVPADHSADVLKLQPLVGQLVKLEFYPELMPLLLTYDEDEQPVDSQTSLC